MGKNNKNGNSNKEVAKKSNEEVNNEVNNAEIVENVEQVEQAAAEQVVAEPTNEGSISEVVSETMKDADKKASRKFTRKNGKTERLVKSVEYALDDAIELAESNPDKFTEEQVSTLKAEKQAIMEALHEAADAVIKKENDEIAAQIKAEGKERSDKKKSEKAYETAVKTLIDCGLSREDAERLIEENKKKASEQVEG